ncbi:zinc-binding dehydrogenase [Amycolatopsis sp. NPDC023774]|uniref:zinc-binding dehydrogenase n=1 Tax=Amycolatopsis sp. NPDC023774 TaxID=3155015 RepID=UPI0033FF2911
MGASPGSYGSGLAPRVRALVPSGVDAVLDTVGRGALSSTSDLAAADVRVASIAEVSLPGTVPVFVRLDQRDLLTLVELAEAGTLSVRAARTFPLAQAAVAQRLLAEGHAPGKVVLVPWFARGVPKGDLPAWWRGLAALDAVLVGSRVEGPVCGSEVLRLARCRNATGGFSDSWPGLFWLASVTGLADLSTVAPGSGAPVDNSAAPRGFVGGGR